MTKRILSNNFQNLEEMDWVIEKCVRCNMCKFPPLARVESKAHSIGCPSFDYFKFHSNCGGGKLNMSGSLIQGRSKVTEAVKRTVFACTLCGACDVSCKFSADIELLDVLFMLRHKVYKEEALYSDHKEILECIRNNGHPLPALQKAVNQVPSKYHHPQADTLLWVGPRFALDPALKNWLQSGLDLLNKGKIKFQLLQEEEPYTGRAALEIGDLDLFRIQSNQVADIIKKRKIKRVICLDAEDYSTLRTRTPRCAEIDIPILHITEIYEKLMKKGAFKTRNRLAFQKIGWHDPTYLGRLGGRFIPWQGTNEKEGGGIRAYIPPRKIDYGAWGVYEAPRKVLMGMTGTTVREFSLKREYTYSCGETGQAAVIFPEFVLAAAKKRVQEAIDNGIETIVTECPQAFETLNKASKDFSKVNVVALTELMSQKYL